MPDSTFGERVAEACFEQLYSLPEGGKPKSNEWTVLSCVVQSEGESEALRVVALGTGSKCLGRSAMSDGGDVLNDSHAEVVARRCFLRYLYEQMDDALRNDESIFCMNDDGRFALGRDVRFHFFSTQLPCGDAAIVFDGTNLVKNTGAKRLDGDGTATHDTTNPSLGLVRKKPGKGDPTMSVSCSDKLARWFRVGIQGALLDIFLLKPIYLTTLVVGGDGPFCKRSLDRALLHRDCPNSNETESQSAIPRSPDIIESKTKFIYRRMPEKRPCFTSLTWCRVKKRPLEIAVEGKKLGVTKKCSKKVYLTITKRHLFKNFISLLKKLQTKSFYRAVIDKNADANDITYKEMKNKSLRYNKAWLEMKKHFFGFWPQKPDILNFSNK